MQLSIDYQISKEEKIMMRIEAGLSHFFIFLIELCLQVDILNEVIW